MPELGTALLIIVFITFDIAVLIFVLTKFIKRKESLHLGQPKGQGYAPGWVVRCPECDLTVDAGKAGFTRIGYIGKPVSRKRGWCDECQKKVYLIIEGGEIVSNPSEVLK